MRGGVFRATTQSEPNHLDRQSANFNAGARPMADAMFEALVRYDKNLNPSPELALSWDTPNETTYVFKLRPNVKFHDGTPFNAQAVKFNFERMLNPQTGCACRSQFEPIKDVEVIDDLTVRITTKIPYGPFLGYMDDVAIVSPAAVQKYGKDYPRNPVGTGPFKFVEWVPNDHVTLQRFEDYWDKGKPYLDEVRILSILDPAVKLSNLRTGNVDFIDSFPIQEFPNLSKDSNFTVVKPPAYGFNGIRFNLQRPPFNNKALRQATAYAIDRETIAKNVLFGVFAPGEGPLSPLMWAYDKNYKGLSRDLTKAKAKLVEGGQPNGFKFEFSVSKLPTYPEVAEALAAQLAEVGIQADIQIIESGRVFANLRQGNFITNIGGYSDGDPDPDNLFATFHTKGSSNWGKYSNPEVDRLLEEGRSTLNREKRVDIYRRAQTLIVDDAPYAFVYHPWSISLWASSKKVHDANPVANAGWAFWKHVWIEK